VVTGVVETTSDAIPSDLPGWVTELVRWRYALLAAAALAWVPVGYGGSGGDWAFLRQGALALVGRGAGFGVGSPLSLYADAPSTQIGPPALVGAVPFSMLGRAEGRLAATIVMALALPLFVWLLEGAARKARNDAVHVAEAALVGGLASSLLWHAVAVQYAHLDDVIVLLAGALALRSVAAQQPWNAGLWAGLAMSTKPWAIGFLAFALSFRGRDVLRAAVGAIVVLAASWLPFLLGDPRTLQRLGSFHIAVQPDSVLRLLGVQSDTMPAWVRPSQALVSFVLAAAVVRAGRWAAVPLVAIASRIVLDPATLPYYFTGLAAATLAWDLIGSRRRLPWWTIAIMLIEYDVRWLTDNFQVMSVLHLTVCLAALSLVLPRQLLSYRWPARARSANS
jgi:hypothetical protein